MIQNSKVCKSCFLCGAVAKPSQVARPQRLDAPRGAKVHAKPLFPLQANHSTHLAVQMSGARQAVRFNLGTQTELEAVTKREKKTREEVKWRRKEYLAHGLQLLRQHNVSPTPSTCS